jgi:hypothetical protein
MAYPRLIALTGMDGSGKTTACIPLVKYFRSRGYKTKYVWIRSLHSFAYAFSKILESLSGPNVIVNPDRRRIRRFDGSPYAGIWTLIEFVSVLPLIIFKIRLPLLLGYTVVSDRCAIDTVISIAAYIRNPLFVKGCLSRILLATIPKGVTIIYFETDLKTILKRKPNIEYTEDEIKVQLMLYDVLTRVMGTYRVKTSENDVNETFKAVLNIIEKV